MAWLALMRVHSRWVCISSGIILILFGMVPKMAVPVASIRNLCWWAGLVMFGMVLATGIRIRRAATTPPTVTSSVLRRSVSALARLRRSLRFLF
ncbi:solute carrier family 23 protein [Escherichia coli]